MTKLGVQSRTKSIETRRSRPARQAERILHERPRKQHADEEEGGRGHPRKRLVGQYAEIDSLDC